MCYHIKFGHAASINWKGTLKDSMSAILILLSLPTADMILHNSHIVFQHHCVSSCNRIVKWFVTVGLWSVLFMNCFFFSFTVLFLYRLSPVSEMTYTGTVSSGTLSSTIHTYIHTYIHTLSEVNSIDWKIEKHCSPAPLGWEVWLTPGNMPVTIAERQC